jgi:muconolactone delta-isomerase
MHYLIQMKLTAHSRPSTPQEEAAFIEGYIFPSLELCKKLEGEKKILAGGPMSGTIGIALIVNADSAQELDELVESLPLWPLMETAVIPLTTFDGRIATVRPRLERLKASLRQ